METRRRCETIEDNSLECHAMHANLLESTKDTMRQPYKLGTVPQALQGQTGKRSRANATIKLQNKATERLKNRPIGSPGKFLDIRIAWMFSCSVHVPLPTQRHSPSLTTGRWCRIRNSQHLGNCGNDEQVNKSKKPN